MKEMSLLERFLTEKRLAAVVAADRGNLLLIWKDETGESRCHNCAPGRLDDALSEILDAADEQWLRRLGLRPLSGDVWVSGNTAVLASSGRQAVAERLTAQDVLEASGKWRAVTPGIWVRDTPDARLVYEGPTGRLTTTTTRTVTPAEVPDLCK